MQTRQIQLPRFEEIERNIPICLILCFVTFGIYNLFWLSHQMKVWNQILGYKKYGFWKWALLCLCTFGLYHIYFEYTMAIDMMDFQRSLGRPVNDYLPLISVLLAFMALPFVADAVQQYELQRLYARENALGSFTAGV